MASQHAGRRQAANAPGNPLQQLWELPGQIAANLAGRFGGGPHAAQQQRSQGGSAVSMVPSAPSAAPAAAAAAAADAIAGAVQQRQPVSREELGRSTWTLLHTLAAQLPDKPSRQQQRDVRLLVDVLTRIYPCGDCAQHWKQIVKGNPPQVQTRAEFQQWLCRSHNVVNRSLGKPPFNCDLAGMAWGRLDCGGDEGDGASAVGCELGAARGWK